MTRRERWLAVRKREAELEAILTRASEAGAFFGLGRVERERRAAELLGEPDALVQSGSLVLWSVQLPGRLGEER